MQSHARHKHGVSYLIHHMNQHEELVIDVSAVTSVDVLHDLIARALRFPASYRRNWESFDECIRDFPPNLPIQIRGFQEFENAFPSEASLMRSCFLDFAKEMPSRRRVHII